MESIKEILIRRDGMTPKEADDLIEEARSDMYDRMEDGDLPFDVCEEYFGLEPDYLDELMSL